MIGSLDACLEANDGRHDGEHEDTADLTPKLETAELRPAPLLIALSLRLGDLLKGLFQQQRPESSSNPVE